MTAEVVAVEPKLHREETPNTPFPIRGGVMGENQVFGLVVPNLEKIRESGLIIANVKETQNIPHVFTLMQVSEKIDANKYPLLAAYKEKYDPKNRGNVFIGPQMLYRENMGYEWDFPEAGNTWVQLDAKQILRWFPPFQADLSLVSEQGRMEYEQYERMLNTVKRYIEDVQSKSE